MFLGRIISKRKVTDVPTFIEIAKEYSENADVPTLVVGKELAESSFGTIKVLDRKVGDNLYWTFGKTERRMEYEDDLSSFISFVVSRLKRGITYYNLTPYTMKYSFAKRFISYVDSPEDKAVLMTDKHVYFYNKNEVVTGISLNDLDYMGINKEKVKNRVKSNPHNKVFTDLSEFDEPTRKVLGENNILATRLYYSIFCA